MNNGNEETKKGNLGHNKSEFCSVLRSKNSFTLHSHSFYWGDTYSTSKGMGLELKPSKAWFDL